MALIKRYPNRKLYDTDAKSYITLDAIAQMIRHGQDVQVIDHESGDDLTNLTLSQIIFEQEKKGAGALPRTLLTGLIRTGGDTVTSLWRALQGSMEADPPPEARLAARLQQLLAQGQISAASAAALQAELGRPGPVGPDGHEHTRASGVDDRLKLALERLNLLTHADLRRLQLQLDQLSAKLDTVLAESGECQAEEAVEEGGRP